MLGLTLQEKMNINILLDWTQEIFVAPINTISNTDILKKTVMSNYSELGQGLLIQREQSFLN